MSSFFPESCPFKIFENQITLYGIFGWVVIWKIAQPLGIFFRFHSFMIFLEAILTDENNGDGNNDEGGGIEDQRDSENNVDREIPE